ncbi:MAG TPA: hypothetical protein VGZ02_08850 [Candidatus Baltobacteraceae bacterium]|jgi:hypothetical protein|nr:hypothetical protein [Candidatus Baltobacteraceae bacterium]
MLGHILLAAVLATPSPNPSASPELKTIASVRASARCAEIITHANSAIATTLDDNHVITQTITQLRLVNLDDGNPIHRYNGLNALRELASSLDKQSQQGSGEIKRLRDLAAKSTDPAEQKELKSFADALGGALGRQLKMARDLNGYLAYVDYTDMLGRSDNGGMFGNGFSEDPFTPPALRSRTSATAYAQNAAADFQTRFPSIIRDENTAATHVDGALSGC